MFLQKFLKFQEWGGAYGAYFEKNEHCGRNCAPCNDTPVFNYLPDLLLSEIFLQFLKSSAKQ